MDCSKSDPNSSLYKGGKWARTMSGYIALKAVSFSVCLLHSARSVDTLHINCGKKEGGRERGDGLFRFTGRQGQEAVAVENRRQRRRVLPSHGVANRILTQAPRRRDKLTLHITGLDLINCVLLGRQKPRRGARSHYASPLMKEAAASPRKHLTACG